MAAWDGFEECVAVADAGSFVGAARRLGLSTSHISRAVASLERRIDAPLFFRSTRRVSLTDTGRALVQHCRRMIEERDDALALVSGGGEIRGVLRMTCATTMGERFIGPIVRRYAADHPGLDIHLDLTNRVVDLVGEGYDLAVRTGRLPGSRMIGTRIGSRQLQLCAAPAYLARHGTPQSIAELADHACLVGTSATWHFRHDGADHVHIPTGRFRCNSGATIAEAALAGMGICQLPSFYTGRHVAAGALVPLLDAWRGADEPIWAVYPERRHLIPKVRGLVDRLRDELAPALQAASEPRG